MAVKNYGEMVKRNFLQEKCNVIIAEIVVYVFRVDKMSCIFHFASNVNRLFLLEGATTRVATIEN
jgi:hypothetical protein